jgi:cell division protease FtsH
VRAGADQISKAHFEYARDRVLMGQTRESMALSDQEKETTAYHEAGHAICAAVLEHADPVHKVTIIPRGMALGVTQTLPPEDRHSYSLEILNDSLVMMMGGRVAEKIVFGHLTTGASDDLRKATERARAMVRELGMSERVGPRAWGNQGQVFLGDDLMQHHADYGDDVAQVIDEEIDKMLREAEQRCLDLLNENRRGLDLIARSLLEHETIDGDDVVRLVNVGRSGGPAAADETTNGHGVEQAGTVVHDD